MAAGEARVTVAGLPSARGVSARLADRVVTRSAAAPAVGFTLTLVVLLVIALTWADRPFPTSIWLPYQLAGLSFLVPGAVLWWQRPEDGTGRLMALTGASWYMGNLQLFENQLLFGVGFCFYYLYGPLLGHTMMTIPDGHLPGQATRITAIALYLVAPGTQILRYFDEPSHEPQMWGNPALSTSVWADVGSVGALTLTACSVYLVIRRFQRAGRPLRRMYALVWVSMLCAGVSVIVLAAVCLADIQQPLRHWMMSALSWGLLATPVAMASGLVLTRLSRIRVADLVVELARESDPTEVRNALSRALDDPSLQVLYWLPEQNRYVHGDGRPAPLDPTEGPGVTLVESRGRRLAALLHDPALSEQRALVAPVVAVARMALENAALEATAQAQVTEIQTAKARLLSAADSERRRIQRDLHDGAQHRLLAVSMLLERVTELERMTEWVPGVERRGHGAPTTDRNAGGRALLDHAREELITAVRELRELTEGIHPPALTEQGLTVAVEILAERAPLPVEAWVPDRRWPEQVERTAYYVVAEALVNVYRHAGASSVQVRIWDRDARLHVVVVDDGRGGTRPRPGGGLQGLQDRAQALGGRFRILDRRSGGTVVHLEVPCAS